MPSASRAQDYEAFANDFGFEETADQNAAIHAVIQDMISPQPDGPAGLRRRRLRQDRGGAARRLHRRHRRQAGGLPRADHAAGRAALPDAGRPLRQVAGEGGRDVAASARARKITAALKGLADGSVDIVVGTHKLLSRVDQVQEPGPAHHRRGAPLRRAPQGGDEGDARRGRRAHAHRHADPAHAGHGAGRPARPVGDRHRAAAAAGHQDLRAQRGQRRDPRGGAARAEARRPGLLPAQRGRDHREPARSSWRSCCPRRASPWPTARCPSASWSA